MTSFGDRLRELRRAAKLTQRQLAEKVSIDFTYLSKLENDRGDPPSDETIRRLAAVLGADEEDLLALGGKLPAELKDRASQDVRFAMLLRRLPSMTRQDLDDFYRRAGVPERPK